MERLELYLSENYVKEKEQQESVRELIKKVIPMYGIFCKNNGWGYSLDEPPVNISTSTIAMVAFSMSVLMSGKPDLVMNETRKDLFNHYEKIDEDSKAKFKSIFKESLQLLFYTFMNGKERTKSKDDNKTNIEKTVKDKFTFESSTYGNNDPFTLMWARYLFDNNKKLLKGLLKDDFEEIEKNFDEKCLSLVGKIFHNLYKDRSDLGFPSKIEKSHVFPLLKTVQLYYAMNPSDKFCEGETDKEKNKYVNEVRNTLKNSLHHHLSLASIENSNFDAAELVFSLEGMLLLDFNRDNFHQDLLNRVFQVVTERQKISLYWRPLKPFVSNKQGLALLPLSVEIAMSLIRICRLLGKRGVKLFSKNFEMFEKYTEWVKTRVTAVVSCREKECNNCEAEAYCLQKRFPNPKIFYGWCSEHIYQPDVVHQWETSQVMVYLVNFIDMLQKHIAYQSLKFANLYKKECDPKEHSWSVWQESEPVSIEGFKIYEEIGKHYLDSSNYCSMLLYGPPGTGKSTIAEQIAMAKGWPLVTITPSDFIASGADQVETKAKSIFKVLEEQEEIVVLFDEIDRLILDRDSKYYTSQSDLFQFMTPSMLVKLKDLRTKKKIIFIIATNYEERIDMAIKRKGRIDEKYLVLPPDKNGREKLFKGKNEDDKFKKWILNKTALYTFTEFTQLAKVIKDNTIDGKVNKIEKPAITLMSYKGKLGTNNIQKPVKEFLSLVFLKAEAYDRDMNEFDKNELGLLIDFLKEMLGKDTKEDPEDNLDMILTDKDSLTKKLNEHIGEDMTAKIIEVLDIINVEIKEAAENKC